jgi:hypothetical protein
MMMIQFNSILYYLCAKSTATRPITDAAQHRYNSNNSNMMMMMIIIIIIKIIIKPKLPREEKVLVHEVK